MAFKYVNSLSEVPEAPELPVFRVLRCSDWIARWMSISLYQLRMVSSFW